MSPEIDHQSGGQVFVLNEFQELIAGEQALALLRQGRINDEDMALAFKKDAEAIAHALQLYSELHPLRVPVSVMLGRAISGLMTSDEEHLINEVSRYTGTGS